MRKLLFFLLFTAIGYSQNPAAKSVLFEDRTTTERDAYSSTVGKTRFLYNTTTGQFEYKVGTGSWTAFTGGGGLSNLVEDTTPQLGGDLDLNSSDITGTGDINITGAATVTATLTGGASDFNGLGRISLGNYYVDDGVNESTERMDVFVFSDFFAFDPITTNDRLEHKFSTNQWLIGGDEIVTAGTTTGTNTGDQTITLTGDVTGSGTGSFATTIATDAVDIAMLSATGTADGTTFLRGDNTWAVPSGSGDMILATAQTSTGKKTFTTDATNPGLRILGASADPSSQIAGDMWYRTDTEELIYRGATNKKTIVTEELTPAALDLANATGLVSAGIVDGTITADDMGANSVDTSELVATAVTPGSYTNTNLTVDADGRITAASNGSAPTLPVADGTSIAEGSSDATKEVRFEVDGLTTGTTRVLTMADNDVDLGLMVKSDVTGVTGADPVENMMLLTVAEYEAISSPDANTVYFRTDAKQELSVTIPLTAIGGDVATGTDLNFWEVHDAITITKVAGFVLTAGTTSTITIDIHEDGTTIMTTDKIEIEATDKWSEDATDQPALTDTAINAKSILTFDIDTADSGDTGTDPSVTIWYTVD